MFDDNAARRALHTLTDEPAPPVVTTLDQVLKRGRRRVFVQRAGAVAGVMAVVAAIGVSAVLLRPGDEQDGFQVAGPTSPPGTSQSVPSHADTTPPITSSNTDAPPPPTGGFKIVPGWDVVVTRNSPAGQCDPAMTMLPPEPEIDILPQDIVQPAFVSAVKSVTRKAPSVAMAEWEAHSPKAVGPRGYVAVEFPVANGNAQVQLEAVRYGGTPIEFADASVTTYGNCTAPPLRRTLSDGTVMQLYPPNSPDTPAPTQPLQIYRPDNRLYIVTAAGYAEGDKTPNGGMRGGRGAVPLTAEQLADVATELVANLR